MLTIFTCCFGRGWMARAANLSLVYGCKDRVGALVRALRILNDELCVRQRTLLAARNVAMRSSRQPIAPRCSRIWQTVGVKQRERFYQWADNTFANVSGTSVISELELARAAAENGRTVVLVEGVSDKLAVYALAKRLGRDLDREGMTTIVMGGATNIGRFLEVLGPHGLKAKLAGLCDVGEEHHFRRALERAGMGSELTNSAMETLGFYMCDADLEDELIRSVGVGAVLDIVAGESELKSFRTFQRQRAWQERSDEAQLRRWLGTSARRKTRYATLLVGALDLERVPAPLEGLLYSPLTRRLEE